MSQETLADNQDCRVRTTRNIVFVAFPDVELLDVCGPFDVFAFAGADKGREVFLSLSVETHSRPDLRGLQTWILAYPHADLSIEALAERVAMSRETLRPLFRNGDGHDAGQVRGGSAPRGGTLRAGADGSSRQGHR